MKKTYIAPSANVVELRAQSIMAMSTGPQATETSANQIDGMDVRGESDWDIW